MIVPSKQPKVMANITMESDDDKEYDSDFDLDYQDIGTQVDTSFTNSTVEPYDIVLAGTIEQNNEMKAAP